MSEIEYQKVFEEIQKDLPNEWSRMVLFVAYTPGSYSMKYYYSVDGKTYTDCFSNPGVKIPYLITEFSKIDKIISENRKTLPIEKKWTVMTMLVESEGDFNVQYDYSDVSENMIEYEKKWKSKYLV